MDLFTLDSQLRRTEVFDRYESLIWTERFRPTGDFELDIPSTWKTRSNFKKGTKLAINGSRHVMTVETNDEKSGMLKVTGRSLEYILEDRTSRHAFTGLTSSPRWPQEGTPTVIIRSIFNYICVNGSLNIQDKIPFIQSGTISEPGSFPEPSEVIRVELEPEPLFDSINNLCMQYNMGFRIIRGYDDSKLYFEVYTGSDRTAGNTTGLEPVIFSKDLDNLADVSELTSLVGFKNVAYVFSNQGSTIVYANGASSRTGFERRILTVKLGDIRQNDNEGYLSNEQILQRRGLEALAQHRQISAFDGEILKTSKYQYGVHYELGDVIEVRNTDNIGKAMRVTEQIFVSDAEGDRSYPTLSADEPTDL